MPQENGNVKKDPMKPNIPGFDRLNVRDMPVTTPGSQFTQGSNPLAPKRKYIQFNSADVGEIEAHEQAIEAGEEAYMYDDEVVGTGEPGNSLQLSGIGSSENLDPFGSDASRDDEIGLWDLAYKLSTVQANRYDPEKGPINKPMRTSVGDRANMEVLVTQAVGLNRDLFDVAKDEEFGIHPVDIIDNLASNWFDYLSSYPGTEERYGIPGEGLPFGPDVDNGFWGIDQDIGQMFFDKEVSKGKAAIKKYWVDATPEQKMEMLDFYLFQNSGARLAGQQWEESWAKYKQEGGPTVAEAFSVTPGGPLHGTNVGDARVFGLWNGLHEYGQMIGGALQGQHALFEGGDKGLKQSWLKKIGGKGMGVAAGTVMTIDGLTRELNDEFWDFFSNNPYDANPFLEDFGEDLKYAWGPLLGGKAIRGLGKGFKGAKNVVTGKNDVVGKVVGTGSKKPGSIQELMNQAVKEGFKSGK